MNDETVIISMKSREIDAIFRVFDRITDKQTVPMTGVELDAVISFLQEYDKYIYQKHRNSF